MSQINPNNINGTYPVAGQDNDTQGFRDNFTNIKNNFNFASQEITDLQNKVLLKSALNGTSLNNNLNGAQLVNAQLKSYTNYYRDLGTATTAVTLDFNNGNFQKFTTNGPISISFSNWPSTSGSGLTGYANMRVWIYVNSVTDTIQVPLSVSIGSTDLAGFDPVSNKITFDVPGDYVFDFSSADGGANFLIFDNTRNRVRFRDPSFYFNPDNSPTLLIGYGADALPLAVQNETGQDIVSVMGSYNSVTVGDLTTADYTTGEINNGATTAPTGGYSVTSIGADITDPLNTITTVPDNSFIGYFNALAYTGQGVGNDPAFSPVAGMNFFASGTDTEDGIGGNIAFFTAANGTASLGQYSRQVQALGIENDQSVQTFNNLYVGGNLVSQGGRVETGYTYLAATTGGSQAIPATSSRLVLDPASTIATFTATLPHGAGLADGTVIKIGSTAQITALTVSSASGTVKPSAAFQLNAGTGVEYFWHATESTWYKLA